MALDRFGRNIHYLRISLTDHCNLRCVYCMPEDMTFRPNTERPITVTAGTNTLVGEDLALAEELVDDILMGHYKEGHSIPGWDGEAASRVVDALEEAWAGVLV